jgi:hypothetical protein
VKGFIVVDMEEVLRHSTSSFRGKPGGIAVPTSAEEIACFANLVGFGNGELAISSGPRARMICPSTKIILMNIEKFREACSDD